MRAFVTAASIAAAAFLSCFSAASADDERIQRVISPGGIEAWLVEESAIPMIAVEIGFEGGALLDSDEQLGVASFTASMIDEGAGEYDSQDFAERLEELSARMSFEATREQFYVGLRTLTETRDESFALLKTALTEPRFDDEPLERVRNQILVSLKRAKTDPNTMASRAWYETMLKGSPFARPISGHEETIEKLSADDLRAAFAEMIAKSRMKIGVVGDIDAETLGPLLDATFGELSEGRALPSKRYTVRSEGGLMIVDQDVPQSVAVFGHKGVDRDDPDFIPAYVLNYVLGGGSFESRLTKEVRVERGLAYSVYSYLNPITGAPLYMGGVATANERIAESLDVIKDEWNRIAEGISAEELEAAKKYLTGSYALRFDSNAKIARYLVGAQVADLGIDYIDIRNGLVEAVTLDDVKRIADRMIKPENLFTVVVGRPEGLESTEGG